MTRICKLCGKEFEPSHFNQRICKDKHYRDCPVCGKPVEWVGYERTCSKKCTRAKTVATNLERYGGVAPACNAEVQAKQRATIREHYGVDYPGQNSEIRAKQLAAFDRHFGKVTNPEGNADRIARTKATNIAKYGATYYMNSPEGRQRSRETNLRIYGTSAPIQNEKVKAKYRSTMLQRYGYESNLQIPEIRQRQKVLQEKKYGELKGHGIYDQIKDIDDNSQISRTLFKSVLDALQINYTVNAQVGSKVYDFKLDNNLLLSIDDTSRHNIYAVDNKKHHVELTSVAINNGFRCMHIFDWDNIFVIGNMLLDKVSVHGRHCTVSEIDRLTCDTFLKMYHSQGTVTGQKVRYGLYYNNELMSVMTFGSSRYKKDFEWELLRYCTVGDRRVVGGASKMFTHFIERNDPESIISYCDRAKFSGKVYEKLGMTLSYTTDPSAIWSRGADKILDRVLNTVGYDRLFGTSFGKGTSNTQLMLDNGWLPVYDCGQSAYTWKK